MVAKKRYFPARPKGLPKGYDSWPEYELHQGLLKDELFHPPKVEYVVKRKYEPDFEINHEDGKYLLEFKGYFREASELSKYVWVREALPDNTELLFVFDNPDKPIHFKPVRKCGTRMTCGQWAEKNSFRYFSPEGFETFYKELKDE